MTMSILKIILRSLFSFGVAASLLPAQSFYAQTANSTAHKPAETNSLTLPKIFHIAGIQGLKRNGRGDLVLSDRELIFKQKEKQLLVVPLERIRRVELLSGERHYGKSTAIAYTAAGLPGALLILKKRKVDTLVIDYLNERGGLMGLVVQVPQNQGEGCKNWVARHGATIASQTKH